MADNRSRYLKMARLLAFGHILIGVLLFILGIVDRVHGYFWSGEGCFGIWCGLWMCITGVLGIPASSRERTSSSNALAAVYMGFAITSAVFGGVTIICYSIAIATYHHYWYYDYYRFTYQSEMAITAIILILGITEFAIGIWAATLCCMFGTCNCCSGPSNQPTSVVYMTGQGVPAGYVMAQGPGGVPVAMPVQQAGGVMTFPGGQPAAYQVSTAAEFGGQPQMVPAHMQGTQMVFTSAPGVQMQMGQGAEGGQGDQIPVKI